MHVVAKSQGMLRGKTIRPTDPWRLTWLPMVREKPCQNLSRRATLKNLRYGAPTTVKPVVEKLPVEAIDYDARDVQEYARTHPPSPASDSEMLALVDPKRGQNGDFFSPRKSSKTGVAEKKEEQTVLDNSTVQEPHLEVPRTNPQGRLSPASASQLFAPIMLDTFNMCWMLTKWMTRCGCRAFQDMLSPNGSLFMVNLLKVNGWMKGNLSK